MDDDELERGDALISKQLAHSNTPMLTVGTTEFRRSLPPLWSIADEERASERAREERENIPQRNGHLEIEKVVLRVFILIQVPLPSQLLD